MTSDAKVGVLLGLVFIFMIAFLINGLPKLSSDENNNELTTNMVKSYESASGLGSRERAANRAIIQKIRPSFRRRVEREENEVRFTSALPKPKPKVKEEVKKLAAEQLPETIEEPVVKEADDKKAAEQRIVRVEPSRPAFPKAYVVKAGENLSSIAKKVYGPEAGNRYANVMRIYQANGDRLDSPDEVYEGQKLMIPALVVDRAGIQGASSILASSMVDKVKSIGRRHKGVESVREDSGRWYVVKDGESLWEIASEQLGDGIRYSDIAELNAHRLSDEDSVKPGMRLKLPER